MTNYDHKNIEKKWQEKWLLSKTFFAQDNSPKPKFYDLGMFPYPSGAGLHLGHTLVYTCTDIQAKYNLMKGHNVMHPMGWDAFGLPAENFAIKSGIHPAQTTQDSIKTFTKQLQSLGFGYDWDRLVDTSSPQYYKWTQWFFLLLYKNGLAYKKNAPVNWCEKDKTVLANEQVVNGKCERCGTQVIQKNLNQWFFKITDFAEDLITDLDKLEWSDSLKTVQCNWIGKSVGTLVDFKVKDSDEVITVFTTRVDTIFSGAFVVLAPDHPMLQNLKSQILNSNEVEGYQILTRQKNEMERTDLSKDKTGVELKGVRVINPVNQKELPVWIGDFVLAQYGTGAIFGDAHDERDFVMAKNYGIDLTVSIRPEDENHWEKVKNLEVCFTDDGILINSGEFDGLTSDQARMKITDWLEENGLGKSKVNYKLRDWLVSRQRYWGAPIPIIHCEKCGEQPVPEDQLPVELPTDVDFRPTGESPLVYSQTFHEVNCPKCGEKARREVDTMDTFVCSSWYFFRYTDPMNEEAFADKAKMKKWLPVDLYVGGMEHAVLHLLYARFFTKVLQRTGYIDFSEPFSRVKNQGMVLGEGGEKMSKSLGNVVNPDDVIALHGADALRTFLMFMAAFEDSKPWSSTGIIGITRFLDKVYDNAGKILSAPKTFWDDLTVLLHQTIKKVTGDLDSFDFNTAISALMILNNKFSDEGADLESFKIFLQLLYPFAPHLTQECWEMIGQKGFIHETTWPKFDSNIIATALIEVPVQINSKVKSTIFVTTDDTDDQIKEKALAEVKKYLVDLEVKKIIYVSRRIVNIIT